MWKHLTLALPMARGSRGPGFFTGSSPGQGRGGGGGLFRRLPAPRHARLCRPRAQGRGVHAGPGWRGRSWADEWGRYEETLVRRCVCGEGGRGVGRDAVAGEPAKAPAAGAAAGPTTPRAGESA